MKWLDDLHSRIWFKSEPPEATQIKRDLRKAFYESRHPSHVGQHFYNAAVSMRPTSREPLIIQVAHIEWRLYRDRLADANAWMGHDLQKQVDAVERIGTLQKQLAVLIGEREMRKFCEDLVTR